MKKLIALSFVFLSLLSTIIIFADPPAQPTLRPGWKKVGTDVYVITTTDNAGIGTTKPVGLLQVGTSPNAPLVVLAGGNVGIGTTAPNTKLQVIGNITADTTTTTTLTCTGCVDATQIAATAVVAGSYTATDLTVDADGRITSASSGAGGSGDITDVGSCTTGACFVAGDSDSLLGIRVGIGATSGVAYLNIQSGTGSTFILKIADSGPNDRLAIQQDGNVGIGLTNPSQKLDIIGNILASGTIAGNILTGANVTSGADPGHTHTTTSLSSIDISADTNLSGDTENVLTDDALSIGAGITRDTEWNSIDFLTGIATASLSAEIVAGTAPEGELGGTWASPTVDATHSGSAHHSAVTLGAGNDSSLALSGQELTLTVAKDLVTTAPLTGGTDNILTGADADITLAITVAKDIVAGVGLSGGEDNVLPGADADTTLTFDATELSALTWSAGGSGQFSWDWNLSGTDPKINFNNNSVNIETGNFGIGITAPLGRLQVGTTPGVPLLIVQDGGNVGIGTSSPASKLGVNGDVTVTTEAYDATNWNADNTVPTKDAVRDKIETIGSGSTRVMFPLSIAGMKISGTDISAPLRIDAGDSTWKALGNQSSPMYGLWVIQLPPNYSATPTLRVGVTAASNPGGNLVISVDVQKNSDGDGADMDIPSYDSLNTVGNTMPATAGTLEIIDIPLTNFDSSSTPGDTLKIRLQRDADAAADTLAGNIEFRNAAFLYDRN